MSLFGLSFPSTYADKEKTQKSVHDGNVSVEQENYTVSHMLPNLTFWILHFNNHVDCCAKSFHFCPYVSLCCFFLFAWSVPPFVWLCPSPLPPPQPHQRPLRRYIWSAWAPPASRWVGWLLPPIAAMVPLYAIQSATRPWPGRTRTGMTRRTSALMPLAVCWRGWRSGLSIRCGLGHTLTWARALRMPQWGWKPKRMVGWHLSLTRVSSASSQPAVLLEIICHYFSPLYSTCTVFFWSILSNEA